MNYKKLGDKFPYWKKAADSLRNRARNTVSQADEWLRKQQENRTSWVICDSLDELKLSGNPLVQLEKYQVPKHARAAAVYFAAASGVFANIDDVSRFTRDLMDHDGAAIQQWLRKVFDPDEAREISLWMDTAPGAEVAGGWAHRLAHGHDLGAMYSLVQEYGYVGALEWANHVWLRDFWTPHGVPYLPAGSGSIYEWLVGVGVPPSTAMGLLTINAAEMASGLLFFYSGRRLIQGVGSFRRARDYQGRLQRVNTLISEGSSVEALRLVDETETFANWNQAPSLRLDLSICCLQQSYRGPQTAAAAWGERAFRIAFDLCRSSPNLPNQIPYLGGTQVSFHGLAATVMASAYSSHVQLNKSDWTHVSERVRFGIRRFLDESEKQISISKFAVKNKQMWGYRPYSAATNLLLALDLSLNCGALHNTGFNPIPIRRKLEEILDSLQESSGVHGEFAALIGNDVRRVYPM